MIIDTHAHAAGEYSTIESIFDMVKIYGLEKIVHKSTWYKKDDR